MVLQLAHQPTDRPQLEIARDDGLDELVAVGNLAVAGRDLFGWPNRLKLESRLLFGCLESGVWGKGRPRSI